MCNMQGLTFQVSGFRFSGRAFLAGSLILLSAALPPHLHIALFQKFEALELRLHPAPILPSPSPLPNRKLEEAGVDTDVTPPHLVPAHLQLAQSSISDTRQT